ncbi:Heat shock protein 70-like protein [Smittium mucronatum]|uniref:Heat shock protein 70-like protein n=1 Tax=Smittium mucronatum TaxID=133383 RepID=A0A1R0GNT6_9FUNG|nr:Heat shock protein 70-like protein [Smittium mucronatum]
MEIEKKDTYIGLSIGNFNSVISVLSAKDGSVNVIANEDGDHKTPTFLAFSDSELYAGSQAKHQSVYNYRNTIVGFLDHLSSSEVPSSQADEYKSYSKLVTLDSKLPGYIITDEDQDTTTQVSAYSALVQFAQKLKETAVKNIGSDIKGAVVSVHPHWSKSQTDLFHKAIVEAGLPVIQLIPESSASVLAENLLDNADDQNLITINVGATVTDITLSNIRMGLELVVDSISTNEFCGEKVDLLLMRHFADEFKRTTSIDVIADNKPREILKLKYAVQDTKHTIANNTINSASAPCFIESLSNGLDFSSKITKLRFDMLVGKFFAPINSAITELLSRCNYSPLEISKVLFVGGSSQISSKLNNKILNIFPNASQVVSAHTVDEIVAVGCAKQAHLIHLNTAISYPENVADFTLNLPVSVVEAPIGIKISEDSLLVAVPKNTPLPVVRRLKLSNSPGSSSAYFPIYLGTANAVPKVDEDSDDEPSVPSPYAPSTLLAEFSLDLPSDEQTDIELTFFIDTNKSTTITALDLKSMTESSIKI